MSADNDLASEPTLFSAVLTPHRSLGARGFLALMLALSAISFAGGLFFFLLGAWPVIGFLGVDVALLYFAFRINYRAGDVCEEVIVTPSQLTIRNVSKRGDVAEWRANPLWVRLDQDTHETFGVERLYLVSGGKRFPVAGFLGPKEKETFADALRAALSEARRGPIRTAFQ